MTNREAYRFLNLPLCDTHLHPVDPRPLADSFATFRDIIDYFEYKRVTMCCLTNSTHTADPLNNLKGLYLKEALNAHYREDRVFVYGNPFHFYNARDTAEGYLSQVQDMYTWGMDGYKLLDGKPYCRKKLNRPLCDPIFDPMYAFIEDRGLPVKLHLGDPAYFWGDKSHLNDYAISHGWWYGGGGYPSLESLRAEVDGILTKFPRLKLCLAHFYFMGDDIAGLRTFFERFENVSVDLTPGAEMFKGMTEHYDDTQRFFADYSDRIFFGTDTYNTEVPGDGIARYAHTANGRGTLVRRMLEGDPKEPFEIQIIGDTPTVKPLGLPEIQLRNIYFENHRKLHPTCRPIDRAAAAKALNAFDLSLLPAEYRAQEEENITCLRTIFH